MNHWIIICNSNYYNIKNAFEELKAITWPMIEKVAVGDIAYIYVTGPSRAILYKCEVADTKLRKMDDRAKEYVTHALFYEQEQSYMRLELVQTYPEDLLTYEIIVKNGVSHFQTTSEASKQFLEYVNKQGNLLNEKMTIHFPLGKVVVGIILIVAVVIGGCAFLTSKVTPTWGEKKASNENGKLTQEVKKLEIICYTTTLLVGDSIDTALKADSWYVGGESKGIEWKCDDPEIAVVESGGILCAKSVGRCTVTAEYGGKKATKEITVVDVLPNSSATVSSDCEKVILYPYLRSGDTVALALTFSGDMPERFGASAYYSNGLSLQLKWGAVSDNSVPLVISDRSSREKQGYVTILVYEDGNPQDIVASTKINVRIIK